MVELHAAEGAGAALHQAMQVKAQADAQGHGVSPRWRRAKSAVARSRSAGQVIFKFEGSPGEIGTGPQ